MKYNLSFNEKMTLSVLTCLHCEREKERERADFKKAREKRERDSPKIIRNTLQCCYNTLDAIHSQYFLRSRGSITPPPSSPSPPPPYDFAIKNQLQDSTGPSWRSEILSTFGGISRRGRESNHSSGLIQRSRIRPKRALE